MGKAKNLKKSETILNPKSYTQNSGYDKNISEFEYIITDNEVEALILEANYIKIQA